MKHTRHNGGLVMIGALLKLEIIEDIVRCFKEGKISQEKMETMLKKLN